MYAPCGNQIITSPNGVCGGKQRRRSQNDSVASRHAPPAVDGFGDRFRARVHKSMLARTSYILFIVSVCCTTAAKSTAYGIVRYFFSLFRSSRRHCCREMINKHTHTFTCNMLQFGYGNSSMRARVRIVYSRSCEAALVSDAGT